MKLGTLGTVGSILVTLAAAPAAYAAPLCAGDCSGDGRVSIDELVLGIDVALNEATAERCSQADPNGDDVVSVDELVSAVNDALVGCPSFVGSFHSVVALEEGQSASLELATDAGGTIDGTLVITPPVPPSIGGGGAGAANVPISGSFDLDTGEFSIDGSYVVGDLTIPIHISGTLPGHAGSNQPFMMQIGNLTYTGQLEAGATPTPTPTPITGRRHDVTVGGPNVAFDPEFLTIDVGDTVVWTWVGGPHSVQSEASGPGFSCIPDGRFDSGEKSSGTFAYTFTEPGSYSYHCAVGGHCGQEFESAIIGVVGVPTPTPTRTATRTPTPTETPTPDTIGGVSIRMLGTFAGKATFEISGGMQDARIKIEVIGGNVFVTDLTGFIFGVNPIQFMVDTPTRIFFHQDFGGLSMRDISLTLTDEGSITGVDQTITPGMPSGRVLLDLTRES